MELWKYLKNNKKPLVLYGTGNGADRIIDELNRRDIPIHGIFASDGFVRHQNFRGFTVGSYGELKEEFGEMTVLLSFGTHRPDVIDNVLKIMTEQEVFCPDVPVAGGELFDEAFLEKHYRAFEQVYIMLCDDQSRKVYKNVLRSKLTGEIMPLLECASEPKEAYELLSLSSDEAYLDIGAYTGDTVERFVEWTNGYYKLIHAVEPDQKNYKKLIENTKRFRDVFCYNCCLGDRIGMANFSMDGGRKSRAISEGVSVVAETVDHLLDDQKISLIKMDVEGMEKSVIQGAANMIKRHKPKMDIAAYHRADDLFALPLLLKNIQPDFQLYLRRFSSLPAWDMNYYIKW